MENKYKIIWRGNNRKLAYNLEDNRYYLFAKDEEIDLETNYFCEDDIWYFDFIQGELFINCNVDSLRSTDKCFPVKIIVEAEKAIRKHRKENRKSKD